MDVVRRRVIVSGEVQGVFFRDSCRRAAAEQGVAGWVRNMPDGQVEAVFEGDVEAVTRMTAWARRGPSRAVVEGFQSFEEAPEGLRGFEIRPTSW